MGSRRLIQAFQLVTISYTLLVLCGCFSLPRARGYRGPPDRPKELADYYSVGTSYISYHEESIEDRGAYRIKRIQIGSGAGPIKVDFYERPQSTDQLVMVFPVLGGKNVIAEYFADYFARSGYDAAIVHRTDDFKDPTKVDQLEELLRLNVIRDRIAIDYFTREHHKNSFGSFGISRGAINVALTAGVDPRLKYNVLVMGGSDLVEVFRHSNQPRIDQYRRQVMKEKNFNQEQFYSHLEEMLRTDPTYLSKYLDARNTLLILSVFDRTVPFQYGLKLRREIGRPKTVFLFADHYFGILFTQMAGIRIPGMSAPLFPFPYIEKESLGFYNQSFGRQEAISGLTAYHALQLPGNFFAEMIAAIF